MNTRWLSLFAAVLLLALPTVVPHVARAQESDAETKVDPMDWPTWRGPEQSGVSREKNLITSVDEIDPRTGEGVLWKNEELATRSTPIVMDGKLYTLTRVDEGTPT